MQTGFVDLRAHHRDTLMDHTSFWPSFTDIMTVVVLIFLLTSIVVIARNWELVENLRTSILAERQAAEQADRAAREAEAVREAADQAARDVAKLVEQKAARDARYAARKARQK